VTALGNRVAEVSAGDLFACARKTDGTLWCWGNNSKGGIGDGSTTNRLSPVPVTALASSVTAVSANGRHACAARDDGTLWCWGWNAKGELGDGTVVDRLLPVAASIGGGVIEIAAGVNHDTCARRADGSIWCWGDNAFGQIGDGATTPRPVPVLVISAPPAVPAVGTPGLVALALLLGGAALVARRRRRVKG
jgi:alpha-tubulin suppressor-like RCC1 family protein